jgi:hypothetical protein
VPPLSLDQHDHEIDTFQARTGGPVDQLIDGIAAPPVYTWRVHEYYLAGFAVDNAQDAVARGLGLTGSYTDLSTDQAVQES